MFAAGVPLVESLDSVGGAAGNSVYKIATDKIQQEVSTGTSLTAAMTNANIFPSMVIQMTWRHWRGVGRARSHAGQGG